MGVTTNKESINKSQKRGQVGPATVAAVDELVNIGLKKVEAFKRVARETGRSVGTVTVTYYRLTGKKKSVGKRRAGRVKGVRTGTGSVNGLLGELAKVLMAQEEEISTLREENARFKEIRRLLG